MASSPPTPDAPRIGCDSSGTGDLAIPDFAARPDPLGQDGAPSFSLRFLLIMVSTCALAFAVLGAGAPPNLVVAAEMVIVFWGGVFLFFVGLVLERQGDSYLMSSVVAEASGSAAAMIAMFTAIYYVGEFLVSSALSLIV